MKRILIQLWIGVCLVVGLSMLSAQAKSNQFNLPARAAALTNQGFAQLNSGDATAALKTWRTATELYRQQGSEEGQLGNLINQSLAMRSLGQFPQACQILARDALKLPDHLCFKQLYRSTDPEGLTSQIQKLSLTPIRQLALYHLGEMLQLVGDLPNARIALETVLKQSQSQLTIAEAHLSFGNLERALYLQLRNKVGRNETSDDFDQTFIQLCIQAEKTLQHYQTAARTDSVRTMAQLNEFSFLATVSKWLQTQQNHDLPELQRLAEIAAQRRILLSPNVQRSQFDSLSAIDQVYARLHLVNSLMEFAEVTQSFDHQATHRFAIDALKMAQQLQNQRAISYSLGALGRIAARTQDFSTAKNQLIQAMSIAQSVSAWDSAYQWQQELAAISRHQNDVQSAIQYYSAALDSLDQVRGNLLSITPDLQLSFRDQVEPIYRNFMALLVAQPNPDLSRVIQTYERLKVAELENFLQCGRLERTPLSQKIVSPKTTVFYVLDLDQKVGVIGQTTNRTQFYIADAEVVRNSVDGLLFNLQRNLQADTTLPDEAVLKTYSTSLYQQLIAPAEKAGLVEAESSLVFVMDTAFQGIPLGLLHNGKNYLITQHPLSLSIGLQLQSKRQKTRQTSALIAALSRSSPSFNDQRIRSLKTPLMNVESEVQAIEAVIPAKKLLNERFTLAQLQSTLSQSLYNIVHIATHGQFSSSPDDTFLIAWDQLITAPQLSGLLKSRFQPKAGIDLFVLSACQTAQGDKRSPLGLAGIAAQSGARETLASLWLIDDRATADLIQNFYQNLKETSSAAIALQKAQLKLRQIPTYANPYFWAAFVLIGEA